MGRFSIYDPGTFCLDVELRFDGNPTASRFLPPPTRTITQSRGPFIGFVVFVCIMCIYIRKIFFHLGQIFQILEGTTCLNFGKGWGGS